SINILSSASEFKGMAYPKNLLFLSLNKKGSLGLDMVL
ncbi:MAG: hypothetical protein ACJA1V_001019, partial [Flavobacteriaceae bacterium]